MIYLSTLIFAALFLWRCVCTALGQDTGSGSGLALAQVSRSKDNVRRGEKDGVIRLSVSPITKPEHLAFDAPPHSQSSTDALNGGDTFHELQLQDIAILAGVDGRFHAVSRTTGHTIWSMEDIDSEKLGDPHNELLHPLVRTDHNLEEALQGDDGVGELYIVEPQSGDIFVLSTDPEEEESTREPLRRLPYSVPQLVEHSPFSFDDPNRVFVGTKETSIIELDLDEGVINSVMGGGKTWTKDRHEDSNSTGEKISKKKKGERRRTIQIGRTDYTIRVMSHSKLIQTLSFSTYGPNNMNKSLQALWNHTPDDIYLQPSWDGQTFAFETLGETAIWATRFKEPVVAVFDVLVPSGIVPNALRPIVLLQPRPKLQELFPTKHTKLGGMPDKTVINRIGDSLFAMSHLNYPLVNIAEVPDEDFNGDGWLTIEDGHPHDDNENGTRKTSRKNHQCTNLACFVGPRYTEREGAKSRISRLIDPPKDNEQVLVARDSGDADPTGLALVNAGFGDLPYPTETLTGLPSATSRVRIATSLEDLEPRTSGAAPWTLWLSMAGGFLAIWLLLRKLIKINSDPQGPLIQPLQNPASSESRRPLLGHSRTPSRALDASTTRSSGQYPVFTGATIYRNATTLLNDHFGASSSTSDSANVINEKVVGPVEQDGSNRNVTVVVGNASNTGPEPGTTEPTKGKDDAEESDKEEPEGQDAPDGKKKSRKRRGRGKKNKAPVDQPSTPISPPAPEEKETGSSSSSGGFVMVEREEPPPPPPPARGAPQSLVVSSKVLGYGSHGTIVYEGSLQGRAVAVKRLLHDFVTLASHEVSLLLQADDHPNVIRYYFSSTQESFLYIALELCPCSLADVIETPHKWADIVGSFDPKKALWQITQGLRHLHNLKIIHRDIKPQNILVSPSKGNGHRMLISDFGLCKKLEVDQTSFLPTMAPGSGNGVPAAGTPGWRAPEILKGDVSLDEATIKAASGTDNGSTNPSVGGTDPSGSSSSSNSAAAGKGTRLTKSVDIFALGCLFFYTLVAGDHPFGERIMREVNIVKGDMDLSALERFGEEGAEATDLIASMLEQNPKLRPNTETILIHPFFWTPARRLAFLQDASDRFEIMARDPPEPGLVALETGAFDVVGADWHKRMDKLFIENLGKYRKYQGGSVQDLMRALRNKKHHYQDMPDNLKRHLGPLPDGFLSYFTRRFPRLFLHVHSVISELPLRYEPMFKGYFELEH